MTDLPELYPQDEQTTTYNELRYWREIADSIAAQLVQDWARLVATREHFVWRAHEE